MYICIYVYVYTYIYVYIPICRYMWFSMSEPCFRAMGHICSSGLTVADSLAVFGSLYSFLFEIDPISSVSTFKVSVGIAVEPAIFSWQPQ